MSLIIKPKRGTSTPSTSDIVNGEIAIDTAGQLLYINDGGTIKSIGGGSSSYGDSNVDAHLNRSTANANEVLSWTGSDYDWVAQSGGGSLTIQDEGTSLSTAGTTLNFVGAGVVLFRPSEKKSARRGRRSATGKTTQSTSTSSAATAATTTTTTIATTEQ